MWHPARVSRAIEAELPAAVEPVWPDACVACGRERPGGSLRFTVRREATVYGFRDEGCAEAFFVANPGATLVEDVLDDP